jgi:hypothetical protein
MANKYKFSVSARVFFAAFSGVLFLFLWFASWAIEHFGTLGALVCLALVGLGMRFAPEAVRELYLNLVVLPVYAVRAYDFVELQSSATDQEVAARCREHERLIALSGNTTGVKAVGIYWKEVRLPGQVARQEYNDGRVFVVFGTWDEFLEEAHRIEVEKAKERIGFAFQAAEDGWAEVFYLGQKLNRRS